MLNDTTVQQATFIQLNAADGQLENLASFLKEGALLVNQTESNTKLWYALQNEQNETAIFDIFPNEEARTEHFQGKVAAALLENSATLIKQGWEKGVVPNISNYSVLSSNLNDSLTTETLASYITLTALEGKENELENLLSSAAEIIAQTEPNTLFWCALKIANNQFAIFDTFKNNDARNAHFSGQVAGALQELAENIVEGGWEDGVLKNVTHFNVIAKSH